LNHQKEPTLSEISPEHLPPLDEPADPPAMDADAQIERLARAIDSLFPNHLADATSGPRTAVDVAIEILQSYALDLATHEHMIEFTETGWAIRHPLPCRTQMLSCEIHLAMTRLGETTTEPPVPHTGTYFVSLLDERLHFEYIEDDDLTEEEQAEAEALGISDGR